MTTPTPPAPTPTPPLAPEPVDDDGHDTPNAASAPHHDPRAFTPEQPARYTQRLDGWTPERQRGFLERIAEGATVDEASASVGLTPGVAYRLRRRAAGGAFALGWDAAKLVARPIVAEALFHRAIAGQIERVTRPDGAVIERHRYDNRLAMALLNRLDRHAADSETSNAAARLVAADFDAFLDLVGHEAGPARAGLFLGGLLLGERIPADGAPSDSAHPDREAEAAMAPILALARADLWLRTGSTRAADIATADLDPAARAGWTAEQWSRAEAAGLLRLAPEPAPEQAAEPVPKKATLDMALRYPFSVCTSCTSLRIRYGARGSEPGLVRRGHRLLAHRVPAAARLRRRGWRAFRRRRLQPRLLARRDDHPRHAAPPRSRRARGGGGCGP